MVSCTSENSATAPDVSVAMMAGGAADAAAEPSSSACECRRWRTGVPESEAVGEEGTTLLTTPGSEVSERMEPGRWRVGDTAEPGTRMTEEAGLRDAPSLASVKALPSFECDI